jgi:hypothetical protein
MKTLVSALALLVGSQVVAVAADQTLKLKVVAFNTGEKDGEYHFVGAVVSPDGRIGTKDFSVKEDQNGKGAGHSTYYLTDGSIVANDSFMDTATQTGGHVVGTIQIVSGTGPIRARPAQARSTAPGATRARSRTPCFLTLTWT